jgi:hypothetical protein
MSAVYNNTLFGVPAVVPRLNCMIMYVHARGSYGSGCSILKVQQALMEFGNATAESAGEYKVQRPTKLTGYDNTDHQCWTIKADTAEKIVRLLQAGVPVCYGSSKIPSKIVAGRVKGYKGGCLPADTLTYTNLGWKRIDEIEGQRLLFLGVADQDTRRMFRYGYSYHTGRKPCVRITTTTDYRNSMSTVMSADHYVQLTSGTFVKAGELKRGQCISQVKVYSSYRHQNTKYATIEEFVTKQKGSGGVRHYPIHRLIAEAVFGDITGKVIHHIDGNHNNNAVDNLSLMTQAEHVVGHHNPTWQMHTPENWQKNRANMTATMRQQAQQNWLYRGFDIFEKYPGIVDESTFCRLIAEEHNLYPRQRKGKYGVTLNNGYAVQTGIRKAFGSFDAYYMQLHAYNHVVMKVEDAGEMDCYDVAVECSEPDDLRRWSDHNFVIDDGRKIGSGLVVHNSHAMHFSGWDWKTNWIRWSNSWGKCYSDDPENGWGAWLPPDELKDTGCFGSYGSPYGILAPEYKLKH